MTSMIRRIIPALLVAAAFGPGGRPAHAGGVLIPQLEEFIGVSEGTFDGFGNGPAISGSALTRTFEGRAGDVFSFDFNFLTDEPDAPPLLGPINHFAFARISSGSDELYFDVLADVAESFLPLGSSMSRFSRETGYQNFSLTLDDSGPFSVALGVINVTDDPVLFETGLLVDNFTLGGMGIDDNGWFQDGTFRGFETIGFAQIVTADFGSSPIRGGNQAFLSTVPEPSGIALTATGLLGAFGLAARRARRARR